MLGHLGAAVFLIFSKFFSKQIFENFFYFFQNIFFSNGSFLQKKKLKKKNFTLINMLISSKLFIRHLSRKIVRIESAGEGAATEKSRAVFGGKKINEI